MITVNAVTSFFKRLRGGGVRQDPVRDWLALVTLSAITLLGIIVWNVWAFDTVAQGGVIGDPKASPSSAVDTVSLDAIRAVFEERAAEKAKYVTGVYRYADPSR
ncbi:hypothetical protein HY972_01275 [Candidatus Kaiserbacteria bacterium]|nr:hypothetical protein [Candidatus Kaiserbacteria bacterium]